VFQKLKELSVNLSVYGVGDVAIQIASFLLLPLYVRVLSPADYGVIAVLFVVEQLLRVFYRWGVDAAFMRFYYDCADTRARQTLASTVFFFLIVVSGSALAAGLAASGWLSVVLFDSSAWVLPLRLVFLNAFLGSLSFLPFHVLRIEGRARAFIALTFSTNLATLITKLVLVAGLRMGVVGVFVADTIVAAGVLVVLAPRFAVLIRPRFSRPLLRACLAFGLPRLPHGAAHQVIAGADRYILSLFVPLGAVGVYNVGASLGLGLKLFLSAFETAWAPFYFAEMGTPRAKELFRTVTTYGVLVLALLTAGLAATARDIVRLMTTPQFYGAADIVPWIGLSVAFQGVYLLTSIGINITKKTMYYPAATGLAAATSVALNLILIPRFGIRGAAWANVCAYAVLMGSAWYFSQRVYPMTYEWGRLASVAAAAVVAAAAGQNILPPTVPPLPGVLVRGTVAVASFAVTLAVLGFFQPREINRARLIVRSLRQAGRAKDPAAAKAAAEEGGTLHD
jgi:O-antigen/teichoic acid export membrane protein